MTKNIPGNIPVKMTYEDWMAKGKELFGDDMLQWKFVCPGCGQVQTAEDFRPYKDKGASPESARIECIGRYTNGKSWAFRNHKDRTQPCDYAGYGFFNICPVVVATEGGEIYSFAFAENEGG